MKLVFEAMRNVYPSAGACAAASVAINPDAPGLLSTINGWPSIAESFSLIGRVITSNAAPAGDTRITRTGLLGQARATCPFAGTTPKIANAQNIAAAM